MGSRLRAGHLVRHLAAWEGGGDRAHCRVGIRMRGPLGLVRLKVEMKPDAKRVAERAHDGMHLGRLAHNGHVVRESGTWLGAKTLCSAAQKNGMPSTGPCCTP